METTPSHYLSESQGEVKPLSTDLIGYEIGPFHPSLPGPIKFHLELDGEIISKCKVEAGYCHKGLEKILESLTWPLILPYCDRLDPECALFGELVYCLAVEKLMGTKIPKRASGIRIILSELTRISSHLRFIIKIAENVGSDSTVQYVLRDREKILDLFELLCGARFPLNFLRLGGTSSDVTEGFLERVLNACEYVHIRLKEYNDIFSFNYTFLKRCSDVGVIGPQLAHELSITGPNLRGAGIGLDTRKSWPYCGYQDVSFSIPVGRGEFGEVGDVHDRYLVRLREITESLEIIKQVANSLPPDKLESISISDPVDVPRGAETVYIESARGLLGCTVVSTGEKIPWRVHFKTPSVAAVGALEAIAVGERLADLMMVTSSLDLSISELDK